jgi:DtxR family Mn-dependent transcriptional regulator
MAPLRGEPLADAHAGDRVIVRRVRDTNAEALRFLSRLGLGIGTEVEVTEKQPFNGPLMLEIEGVPRTIGRELAAQVFVEAAHERRN